MQYFDKRINLATALLCLAGVASAVETSVLPIESGNYTVNTYRPCEDAPLAALMTFDGHAFSGAHATACTSRVLARHHKTYKVSTTCRANGDGSREMPTTLVDYLRIESPTHFVRLGQGKHSDYELCPSWH